MFDFWFFVPKSGVAFILVSVFLILAWDRYGQVFNISVRDLITSEVILLITCFLIANRESGKKKMKS